jgi:hypothetical protein
MKILFPILFLSFFFLQTCQNNSAKEHADSMSGFDHQEVKMLADSSLRFLELSGTPYERGLAHGKLLAKEIKEVIQLFKEDIQQTTNENPDEFIAKFLTQTDYKSSVQKWMPELMEELRGISEGSGVDMETIFMHQLGDEYWFNTQDILAHNCSSFGGKQKSGSAQYCSSKHGHSSLLPWIPNRPEDQEASIRKGDDVPDHSRLLRHYRNE